MTKPIAVVSSSGHLGGAELSLIPVVRELAKHRAVLVYLPAPGPLEESLKEAGASVRPGFELQEGLRRASRSYGSRGHRRIVREAVAQHVRLARALRREGVAVTYCNGFRAQLGATLPNLTMRAPVVWHIRDFVPRGLAGTSWSLLSRGAALVIANSNATARQPKLQSVGPRVRVIPNEIDLELFSVRRAEPPGPPVLGMAAHLTEWKGHSRFLRVLRSVQRLAPDVRGAIAGGPIYDAADQRRNAERLAAELRNQGLSGVCSLEPVAPSDMPRWLASLTLLVHCPDRPEPFGRALAEAMAVGVPVVAAAGAGSEEVVGRTGIVCPIGDEGALTSNILRLLNDPSRRKAMAVAGLSRARERFDADTYATRVAEAVLEVAVARSRATRS